MNDTKYRLKFWIPPVCLPGEHRPHQGPYWCIGQTDSTADENRAGQYTADGIDSVRRVWSLNIPHIRMIVEIVHVTKVTARENIQREARYVSV